MNNTELPDLSKWYPVKGSIPIPKGQLVALKFDSGDINIWETTYEIPADMTSTEMYFTKEDISRPPKVPGTTIRVLKDKHGTAWPAMTLTDDGEWTGATTKGVRGYWMDSNFSDSILEWELISTPENKTEPTKEDLMDETDFRNRVAFNKTIVLWNGKGWCVCCNGCFKTLKDFTSSSIGGGSIVGFEEDVK